MNIPELALSWNSIPSRICNERIVVLAAGGTMSQLSDRVWGRGELTDGSKLKYNENYEVYGYKPPLPRQPSHKGKPPKGGGKPRTIKGGYYATYLAMKTQQGRGDTPFELTGDLRIAYLGGATVNPTEVNGCEAHVDLDAASAKKWEGLTVTKGPFLALNADEIREHNQRVLDLYRDLLRGL